MTIPTAILFTLGLASLAALLALYRRGRAWEREAMEHEARARRRPRELASGLDRCRELQAIYQERGS